MIHTKKIIITLFILPMLYLGIVLICIFKGAYSTPTTTPDTVLILGAQIKGETKNNAYPSTVLKERLDTAIPYLLKYPTTKVIVCGGQGSDEVDSEANVMARYLITQGISEERILIEDTSTRTKENIQNAQKKQDLNDTVIVTSDFHVFRSKLLAKRLGIQQVSALPAQSKSSVTKKMYFREIFALSYGILFDW